jgi:hypothetical protein
MGRSEISTSVVKWSEGLSNTVSTIIRKRSLLHIWLFLLSLFLNFFGSLLYLCVYGSMFCMLLFNFVNYAFLFLHYVLVFLILCLYIFLLLNMFYSGYSVSLCCSVYCFYVDVYCTTVTGFQPNYSSHIYHIISYQYIRRFEGAQDIYLQS